MPRSGVLPPLRQSTLRQKHPSLIVRPLLCRPTALVVYEGRGLYNELLPISSRPCDFNCNVQIQRPEGLLELPHRLTGE